MDCPNCKGSKLVMSERKGIEIDYCPDCRGIWLDRGELDKIIEKSQAQGPVPEARAQDQFSRTDNYSKPYKKKKSFLEEIFD